MQNQNVQFIDGGVTSPVGFSANGVLCGIKENRTTYDTALIVSENKCNVAAVFTKNRVQAECVKLSKQNIADGYAKAIIANSGNANACTGEVGFKNACRTSDVVAKSLCISPCDVIVCSTGVIGKQLPVEKIERKIEELKEGLSKENHTKARVAIMTTDTKYKECAIQFSIGDKIVHIGAMCKGSGMIHINMGTMLCFITTDCSISSSMLQKAINESVASTFNCVSVDGDTSTNDTLVILANGRANNSTITEESEEYYLFLEALNKLNTVLAKKIASDGEGATRLVECCVQGAKDIASARSFAKSVISSNLVKAAMFGRDANCGRIPCALGYSGNEFTIEKTSIFFVNKNGSLDNDKVDNFQKIKVYENGVGLDFDEELAKNILSGDYVQILITMGDGDAEGYAWGCDLTYDYVKINGDYRT